MKRILVIEDDWKLNQGICYALQKEKYALCSAHSIREAKEIYQKEKIDLILLDVNLPDGEGFSFCKWVKKQKEVPVLFLTARDLEEDALKGYELGAEDYVTKPFSMKILLKKINVILKRIRERNPSDFDDGFLKMDVQQTKVTVAGELCPLTPTEFRLLKLFIEHSGQLLTYEVY